MFFPSPCSFFLSMWAWYTRLDALMVPRHWHCSRYCMQTYQCWHAADMLSENPWLTSLIRARETLLKPSLLSCRTGHQRQATDMICQSEKRLLLVLAPESYHFCYVTCDFTSGWLKLVFSSQFWIQDSQKYIS